MFRVEWFGGSLVADNSSVGFSLSLPACPNELDHCGKDREPEEDCCDEDQPWSVSPVHCRNSFGISVELMLRNTADCNVDGEEDGGENSYHEADDCCP